MGTHQPKKWPTYALETLENTVDRLKELEQKASLIEDAILSGNDLSAIRELSEVRVMALKMVAELVQSRIGKYDQKGKAAPTWNLTTDEKTAVAQVVATRRQ